MKKAFIFLTATFVVSFVLVSCLRYATEYSENNSNKQAAEYTGIVDNRTVYLENDSNRQNSPQVSTNIVGDVVARFTPLSANERFAYSIQNRHAWSESNRLPMMHWQKMTAYAVRDNNIEDVTKLFLWEPVRLHFIQFTSDFKKMFFVGNIFIDSGDINMRNALVTHNLYMANGLTGEIIKLLANIGPGMLRATQDGKFVGFLNLYDSTREFSRIVIFDVENMTIKGEMEWRPTYTSDTFGFHLYRFGNTFRVNSIVEFGSVNATAEINPATMTLVTLWEYDLGTPSNWSLIPSFGDEGTFDDVSTQYWGNPNVRLRR